MKDALKTVLAEGADPGRLVHLNFKDERIKLIALDQFHLIGEWE